MIRPIDKTWLSTRLRTLATVIRGNQTIWQLATEFENLANDLATAGMSGIELTYPPPTATTPLEASLLVGHLDRLRTELSRQPWEPTVDDFCEGLISVLQTGSFPPSWAERK